MTIAGAIALTGIILLATAATAGFFLMRSNRRPPVVFLANTLVAFAGVGCLIAAVWTHALA